MDKEMLNDVRQTMLKQEAMFREQVRELHNLYWKQKQLTEDVKQRAVAASCQRPCLQPSLELASGFLGAGRGVGLGSGLESKSPPFLAKNATEGSASTTVPRRRTFDLELPAEEYMDVEMEEQQNEKAPAVNSGHSAKSVDSFAQVSVPGLEGGFVNDRGSQIRNSTGEADVEILQMIKRAKSLDEAVARPTPSSSQSFLGGLWGYGFENNTIGASRGPEKSKANGFHLPLGSSEDKGSVLLKSEAYAKTSENQHFVFLEPGYNAQQRLQQASDAKPLQTGVENFNPLFASAERASPEMMAWKDNGKYGAFGGQVASIGTRMPNHVSYSQGILVPSTNMARRESFPEPALGLWWKSNANYYQPQYQQMALLQAGTSAPSAVQVAWQAPGFAAASSSYPHGAMLAIPAVVPPAGYEENSGTSWMKGNGGSSQAFPYSASTPPKPPFKKPPKLILDGATMELKVAPLVKKPSQELLQPETGDSVVAKEISVEQFRRADDAVESCFRHDVLKGDCQIDVSKNDLRGTALTAQRMMDVEQLGFYSGHDLNASGPIYGDRSPEKQNSSTVTAQTLFEAALTSRSSEQHCSLVLEERKQDGGTESEVIQQSESTPVHADASGSMVLVEDSHHELQETIAEALQEKSHTCSCSQPGCFLCSKGTVEDVQMQQRSGKGVDTLASCKSAEPREESRETAEPSSASGKKRRFKLVSSRDLLATRESENGNNGKKPDIDDAEVAPVDKEDAVEGAGAKNGEADRKRRKRLVQSKALKTPKPIWTHDSREKGLDHASRDSDGLKASSVSRAKDRGDNGCSAPELLVENVDDGANLAAEILVSLAPTKLLQSGKDGVLRVHHKSKRRLIDTLSSSGIASNVPVVPSKSTSEPASVKDSKKKKKKKNGKTIVAKIQMETLAEEQKVPLKSVKVVTQCEFGESGGGDKTAAKHKKLVAKKHQMPSRSSSKSVSVKESPAKASTTTLNLVISKSSTRDGVHHHRSHHHHHHQQIDKRNYYNNSSEQESLDRLSQQQNSAGNSSEEIMGKESDELDESSWSRRSWGASARRKRMRRNKRCGL